MEVNVSSFALSGVLNSTQLLPNLISMECRHRYMRFVNHLAIIIIFIKQHKR